MIRLPAVIGFALLGFASACSCSQNSQAQASNYPAGVVNREDGRYRYDLSLAHQPNYQTPATRKTECLGRQLIDLPGEIEWSLADPSVRPWDDPSFSTPNFSETLMVMEDGFSYDGIGVTASVPVERDMFELAGATLFARWDSGMQQNKTEIETKLGIIEEAKKSTDLTPEQKTSVITSRMEQIKHLRSRLAYNPVFDVGVPDSYGFDNSYVMTIYLYRGKRVYGFVTGRGDGSEKAERQRLIDYATKQFRPRDPYEIPKEPGVCLPHGFITGPANARYRAQATFRLKSQPAVLYTLKLRRNGKAGDTSGAGLETLATAIAIGLLPSGATGDYLRSVVNGRVKLQDFFFGRYQGSISGLVGKGEKPGEIGHRYVLTGSFEGAPDTDYLPSMQVQVNGFPQSADASLKAAPLPVADALDIMKGIGRSIRWRVAEGEALPSGTSLLPVPDAESEP